MKRFFFALLLTLGFAQLHAEQIFILFDGTCGDRVLYEQAVAQQPRMSYYAYHFPLAGGTRLMLETGAAGQTVQSYLPQGYVYCGDPRLNGELISRVKSGQDRLFVLTPDGQGQYLIQPVQMVARLQRTGNEFTYESSLTGYEFDMENGIIGENLAYNNPGAKVFFEGRETSPCTGYFLFRQSNPSSAYPIIDYRISPEIGLIERRLGSDGVTTSGGVILAREVNGLPVSDYIGSICTAATLAARTDGAPTTASMAVQQPLAYNPGTAPATTPPNTTAYGNQPVVPTMPDVRPVQPESQAYRPASTVTSTLTHTVGNGETLYGISRKYSTTVDALKAANGLTNNTVYPGQQLAVTTTTTTTPTAPPAAPTTVPTLPYNAGNVAGSNPGAPAPTPYGAPAPAAPQPYQAPAQAAPQPYTPPAPATAGGEVYKDMHVVQPGETVASVALKYGYTSAKFREMNDLGPNDYLRVGQELKTSDCNCPAAPTATPSPQAYGTTGATPQSYGAAPQAIGTAQPQAYGAPQPYGQVPTGQVMPRPQQTGTPLGNSAPAYTPGALAPPPAQQGLGAPAQPSPGTPSVISNNPNFGQSVPNVSAPPSRTMSQMENNTPAAPTTYGQQPVATPKYPVPAYNSGQAGNPGTATPNPYGGTPVGATAPAPARQPAQAAPRSFHIVQEGETLTGISQRYGLTTAKLRELNGLRPTDVVLTYQKLYVE